MCASLFIYYILYINKQSTTIMFVWCVC